MTTGLTTHAQGETTQGLADSSSAWVDILAVYQCWEKSSAMRLGDPDLPMSLINNLVTSLPFS